MNIALKKFFQFKINSNQQQYKQMAHFGGLCNNLMNSTTTPQILALIQKEVGHLSFQSIQEFIKNLSPSLVDSKLNIFQCFYRAIISEYQLRLTLPKEIKIQEVTAHIISVAGKVNQQLSMIMRSILHNPAFIESLRRNIDKNKLGQNTAICYTPQKDKISGIQFESLKAGQNLAQNKVKSAFNFDVIKGPKYQQSNTKFIQNKQTQICYNLQSRPQCVCLNQREIVTKDQFSFKCSHCFRLFHTVCFKRKANSEFCCYCFIEKMSPVKRVVKNVYVALLRKSVKKHCGSFIVPAMEPHQKLQVRCLRLKEGAQNSCLFPDVAEISMNTHKIKEFQPINKQSCLKYRKDQPFTLMKGDYYPSQQNTLIVNQVANIHKQKQIRYDSQNHMFGIYVVEQVKIDTLINEMKVQNVMGFSQSKMCLMQSFKLGKGDDELSCELVKIPLSCPLSSIRIQIPARGIFCTHFQCFDLKNYLTFISQSQNPRWKCPLCPNLAYQLQIDSITSQILKQNKSNQKIQQILFFKNGDYTPIIDDQPSTLRKNIKNLNIPQKKPKHDPPAIEQPPLKKQFSVPINAEVIDLDD